MGKLRKFHHKTIKEIIGDKLENDISYSLALGDLQSVIDRLERFGNVLAFYDKQFALDIVQILKSTKNTFVLIRKGYRKTDNSELCSQLDICLKFLSHNEKIRKGTKLV